MVVSVVGPIEELEVGDLLVRGRAAGLLPQILRGNRRFHVPLDPVWVIGVKFIIFGVACTTNSSRVSVRLVVVPSSAHCMLLVEAVSGTHLLILIRTTNIAFGVKISRGFHPQVANNDEQGDFDWLSNGQVCKPLPLRSKLVIAHALLLSLLVVIFSEIYQKQDHSCEHNDEEV